MRAGTSALSLLSGPLSVEILRALEEEERLSLFDLRRRVGSPPQTTMRGQLRALIDSGILERHQQDGFPGAVEVGLGPPGHELLSLATVLDGWLEAAPDGKIELGSSAAKSAVKAFVDAWSSGMIRVLAAGPLALTDLSRVISDLSYPALERRLAALHINGQIARCPGSGRRSPYQVTDWLRLAMAPLLGAVRWERRNLAATTPPPKRIDVEAMFLLVTPLLSLPYHDTGVCRLAVEMRNGSSDLQLGGAMVEVEDGRVASCISRLEGKADAWVCGSTAAWVSALTDDDPESLEIGGDRELARGVLEGIYLSLYGSALHHDRDLEGVAMVDP